MLSSLVSEGDMHIFNQQRFAHKDTKNKTCWYQVAGLKYPDALKWYWWDLIFCCIRFYEGSMHVFSNILTALRYNWHIMNGIHLKRTIWSCLMHVYSHESIFTRYWTFALFPSDSLLSLCNPSLCPPSPGVVGWIMPSQHIYMLMS